MKKPDFDTYFSEIYGKRWSGLREALLKSATQVVRPIHFDESMKRQLIPDNPFEYPTYNSDDFESVNELNEEDLKTKFVMDPASIIAAKSLDVTPVDFVLDMCAAPGGKSLILLESLDAGTLWSNEISKARREKLKEVIRSHVPSNFRERVYIKGKDGSRYGIMHPDTFDKILVDAPCSGERHLLQSPKELEKWSPKRTKRLSANQYSLLCSALLALKSGGEMVYSTCSISPMENDLVIEKLVKKKGESFTIVPIDDLPDAVEKTEHGFMILPDRSGHGPIYFTKIQKK